MPPETVETVERPAETAIEHREPGAAGSAASTAARAALAEGTSLADYAASLETPVEEADPEVSTVAGAATGGEADSTGTPAAAEADEEAEAGEEGGEKPDEALVVLPAAGELPEFEIPVEDEPTRTRLRSLVEEHKSLSARVGTLDQERAQLDSFADRVEEIDAVMQVDPVGYLLGVAPTQPEVAADIVRGLLSQPEVFKLVEDELDDLSDEDRRTLWRARFNESRRDLTEDVQNEVKVRRNLRDIQRTVHTLTPEGLEGANKNLFLRDAFNDLKAWADQNKVLTIPLEQVPVILKNRLSLYGNKAPANGGKPAGDPPKPKPLVGTARGKTGADFTADARRRSALSGGGGGAGSPAAAPMTPPAGMSVEETAKWHRGQLAKGRAVLPR